MEVVHPKLHLDATRNIGFVEVRLRRSHNLGQRNYIFLETTSVVLVASLGNVRLDDPESKPSSMVEI